MKHEAHNPDYKLIETTVFNGKIFIDLVWGISNDGQNEGLEAYYKRKKDGHFHKSYRWLADEVPPKYKGYYESLSSRRNLVKDGHKLTIELINE